MCGGLLNRITTRVKTFNTKKTFRFSVRGSNVDHSCKFV